VTRTSPGILVLAFLVGVAAGFLVDQILTGSGRATFSPTVALPVFLVALGVIVVSLAIPVRRSTRVQGARVNPFWALRVAVLAKASSIVGALVGGFGAGLALFVFTRPVTPSIGSTGAVIATAVSGLLLVAAALVAENLCTIRKDDDDEHPGPAEPGFEPHHH
jgi:hypothetical protein